MGDPWIAVLLSLGAGLSTTLGAIVPFFISIENTGILSISLAFSAGVMLYVSFVEIYPESMNAFERDLPQKYASLYATLCFFGGILLCAILDFFVHKLDPTHEKHSAENINELNDKVHSLSRGRCSTRRRTESLGSIVHNKDGKVILKSPCDFDTVSLPGDDS